MKRFFKLIWQLKYLLLAVIIFCAVDAALTKLAPVENSTRFVKNDYEITVLSHGGKTTFDKVLCGSSTAINGYIEKQSASGYVNCGIVYGTAEDLMAMLRDGYLDVREDMVIDMAVMFFSDTLQTNPTYPWNRGKLEPYVYFQRDRISPVLGKAAESFIKTGRLFEDGAPELGGKYLVYGSMTDDELENSIASHSELYWNAPLSDYRKNFEALRWICLWCEENGVRLRAFWGPWNPKVQMPDSYVFVMDEVNAILAGYSVETLDMTDAMPAECFYDIGHLNQDTGAVRFTEVLDEWLMS